ncbi:VHS domain-containing protein [Colletotrichum scovillei]|uniref:VHS domain-containing protein n=1 Tax=Colletotrichum scovillei TaxID=1209932 RepID=A0A9P7U5S9_9PEZI|nr:VHS domain-containing protein [Colletotrichum scovillei]KAF4775471.1 VHS domain-containing protein [Colletotrichum scovillei]KAG7042891.1 VHS domain-containing protein [Colletotrichum scovillei]KAG7043481.1 VHS domain-containing protein [Colletotrichum scovillei]KAG7062931.1 VHS domain-containing protein [Colletotrichum scovillei]
MEAASARAAARDRWGEMGAPTPSQLQRFIQAACSPENYEPNLALNLEISDLINSKKGSAPREAAVAIVSYINHRNPNVALLAINLLDICVKNCGYPFHLQISTKEFLNELVRRFPERPPIRATRVQMKILEAIEEWRSTICETSRYKEDLGFIRDMHRLLSYKGYTFPEVRRDDAAVLNPSDNLKSAEEMEEEEREAQSAKLQELIRRGTPEDLQEANRLMKIMAGYDTRSKTDYRAKAAQEVAKIQAKARLLEERLEAFQQGDTMQDGDVFSELAAALSSAQPKIQKMCEEESDDHEAVAKLLEINDSIHRTVERYKFMKKGDLEAAKKVASGAPLPSTSGPSKSAAQELSLIDFDGEPETTNGSSSSQPASQSAGIENDLLGLSMDDSASYGQGGALTLGFGANSNIPGPALLSSVTENNSAKGPMSNTATPQPPSFSQFASFTSPSASQSGTPQPSGMSAFKPPQQQATSSNDPFAALGSPIFSSKPATPAPAPAIAPATAAPAANDDDEWAFSSALPPEAPSQPKEHKATVSDSTVKIEMIAGRTGTGNAINLSFAFSNNSAQPISELHYQLAATKGYELGLRPQTGRELAPKQSRGVTQFVEVWHAGDKNRKVQSIKLRWRISYKVGAEAKNEMGEITEFSLA